MSAGAHEPVPDDVLRMYWEARDWLDWAIHSLPAGVLEGTHPSGTTDYSLMLEDLREFERLCLDLGLDDHQDYIDGCRWHFEHYPHYLSRQGHFDSYRTYIRGRHGPEFVHSPPEPPAWLTRPPRN